MSNRNALLPTLGCPVPDPELGDLLPREVCDVPDSAWWSRRLTDGDITTEAVKAAKPQEPNNGDRLQQHPRGHPCFAISRRMDNSAANRASSAMHRRYRGFLARGDGLITVLNFCALNQIKYRGYLMPITEGQLLEIMPNARSQAGVFISALNTAMLRFSINTPKRAAAFLAQVGHESGQLHYVRELGSDQYLSKYDTGTLAARLGNTPALDGDGQKYRGRGLIQITGRDNYLQCSLGLFGDDRLVFVPQLLEQPQWAAESAAWFWEQNGLNELADRDQFNSITRRINGGLNGLQDRLQLWARARAVLCQPSV